MKTPEKRTILLSRNKQLYSLVLPLGARVTFGNQKGYAGNHLRVYGKDNKQLAAFDDVLWFRDSTVIVTSALVEETQQKFDGQENRLR